MIYLEKPWLRKYPKNIPHEVEIPYIPLFKLIDDAITKWPTKASMLFLGTKISYAEFGQYIEKAAGTLYSIGIGKGSVVAIYLPNCPQFPICYYAIQKLGAIPTAVSFLYTPREMSQQLANSGAECIIMLDLFYEKMKPLLAQFNIKKVILVSLAEYLSPLKRAVGGILGKLPKASIPKNAPVLFFEKLMEGKAIPYPKPNIEPSTDAAAILYTSGTTGLPKGITLSHNNLVASAFQVIAYGGDIFEQDYTKYFLAFLPFFHVYGQSIIMTGGFALGKTLIILPNPKIEELIKVIEKHSIGLFFGVPASYNMMLKKIKNGNFNPSSLKTCLCGSDRLQKNVGDEFLKLTGVEILEGYGLTETCSIATCQPIGGEVREGTIGIPMPSTMVAIADPEKDEFIPQGKYGELLINGPQVMMKIWKDEERTAKCFRFIGGTKWLRTGDVAFMDDDGYVHFVERMDDVIKYKGYQVYPQEVEQVISSFSAVSEVAVVGVETPDHYQIVKAFVVLKDENRSNTKDDLMKWCSENLAEYKIPRAIEFVKELPKNRIGKVLKKELREKSFSKNPSNSGLSLEKSAIEGGIN